jgi:hypothetical protein
MYIGNPKDKKAEEIVVRLISVVLSYKRLFIFIKIN